MEDDETPEMIMAKFAELERIQHAVSAAKTAGDQPPMAETTDAPIDPLTLLTGDQALSDEHLLEVFKQTSMFNVRTALDNNEMLLGIDELLEAAGERYGIDEQVSDDEDVVRAFWGDEDDEWAVEDWSDDEYGPRRKGRNKGRSGSRLQRNAGAIRTRQRVVTAYNPHTQALVRRKVRVADPNEIARIIIPNPPMPLAWGRSVKPYVPEDKRGERGPAISLIDDASAHGDRVSKMVATAKDIVSLQPTVSPGRGFQAVLINVGWERPTIAESAQSLAAIPIPKLVPDGFVFVWVPKHLIQTVCTQMVKWGFLYIENLTWVHMAVNNSIARVESPILRSSHLTLYIFRHAARGRDIELRHQRNPDVTFDCLVPEEAYVAIETLLPTGRGKYLELWADKGITRPGWTSVSFTPAAIA